MSFGYTVLGFGSEVSLLVMNPLHQVMNYWLTETNALDVIGFALDRHNRGKGAIAWRDGTNMRVNSIYY